MQMKASKKHIGLCLLICSLFFASTISVLGTSNMALTDSHTVSSSSANPAAAQSAMSSGNGLGHFNYLAITGISAELFVSSAKPSQWLYTKNIFSIPTSLLAGLITCLIFSSRLAGSLCSQFNSIGITVFLHQKDGMK